MFDFFKNQLTKFKALLSKGKSHLGHKLLMLFNEPLSEEKELELERLLLEADIGPKLAMQLVDVAKNLSKKNPNTNPTQLLGAMQAFALDLLQKVPVKKKEISATSPHIILVVGVNGAGKTTTIAKLATKYQSEGKKVLVAAADTFRAAAATQLEKWAQKCGFTLVSSSAKDPSAIAHDALQAVKSGQVLLIDTAGRLDTSSDLMQQLKKLLKTCDKLFPGSPHETLLVIDATTGQNSLEQAKKFHEFTPLTGIVLTKFDGSAKAGFVLSIYEQLAVPITHIGVGETEQDLMPFDANSFVSALFDQQE